jgi:O-succinylbenzoate synthase
MSCRERIKPGSKKCKQKVWFAPVRGRVEDGGVTCRLETRRYRLPFRAPLRTAHGIWTEREGVLVKVEDASGRIGYGEAATLPWFGTETADDVEEACRRLGADFMTEAVGRLPGRLGCLRHALTAALSPVVEIAQPKAWPVAALLPAGRVVLERIGPLAEAGFRVFKWKVGVGEPADELALLDDVCARLPEGAKLRLDANGAWTRRQAERWLECAAERPVEYVEQPCFAPPSGASQGTARLGQMEDLLMGLAQDFPTPIALDESLVGEAEVMRWLELGWRGIYVLKPALCGDIAGLLGKLAAAKADVVFSSALETALGARDALGQAFAWTGERRALGFGVWPLFADAGFDGPALAPFLRWEDVSRIKPEAVWNALS